MINLTKVANAASTIILMLQMANTSQSDKSLAEGCDNPLIVYSPTEIAQLKVLEQAMDHLEKDKMTLLSTIHMVNEYMQEAEDLHILYKSRNRQITNKELPLRKKIADNHIKQKLDPYIKIMEKKLLSNIDALEIVLDARQKIDGLMIEIYKSKLKECSNTSNLSIN